MKIGFIGTGNMGGALAVAAAKSGEAEVLLANRTKAKEALFYNSYNFYNYYI